MAYELKPWKKEGLSLEVPISGFSLREIFSREINEEWGEGGALNADYRTVEAVAVVSNILGNHGWKYGVHFVFKRKECCPNLLVFDFVNEEVKKGALVALTNYSG